MQEQEPDPIHAAQPPVVSLEAAEAQYQQSRQAYNNLVEKSTPWLFDVGIWIFGGLIAFNLLIMSALITVGPVEAAIKVAAAALAVALPLNVTGLILLRVGQDMKAGSFEATIVQSFEDAGLTPGAMQIPSMTTMQALRVRGMRIVLFVAVTILSLSATLSVTGIAAALWHVAWWISVAFLVTVAISLCAALIAVSAAQPPVSAEEKAQRKAYRDELIRQARERARQAKALAKQGRRR